MLNPTKKLKMSFFGIAQNVLTLNGEDLTVTILEEIQNLIVLMNIVNGVLHLGHFRNLISYFYKPTKVVRSLLWTELAKTFSSFDLSNMSNMVSRKKIPKPSRP